ncbi:MAG: Rrf2 family transcriptional regulator [Fimbriimonadia bacterium]|nr:Rrf2 family transcriptional regulator [Fimbriimonadia bacterium]
MVKLLDIGVKTEYASRALALLAQAGEGAIVTVKDLAKQGDISVHFLYSIFDSLERHGLVHSHKGRVRGFALARPAEEISFLDILQAVEGQFEKARCFLDRRDVCRADRPCAWHHTWHLLRDTVERELNKITLDQIANNNAPWKRLKEAISNTPK